jgi:hypothetical protein
MSADSVWPGDVLVLGQVVVATLYPDATIQYPWGNWFIDGNLTVHSRTEFLFNSTQFYCAKQLWLMCDVFYHSLHCIFFFCM